MIIKLIETVYQFLWGDLIHIPLPGGGSLGISLLILLLFPAGIVFTIKTRFLPIRLFPDMVKVLTASNKKDKGEKSSLSSLQTLIVSTATRVGMGNLTGVVAAVSAGGAGAVFWMWVTALLGSSTAFIEATLAQLHKEKDPLYGGYRGGPAYYIHHFMEEKQGKKKKHTLIAVLFAISGLICWCGISQVVSNSVAESFNNAFHIPTIYTTIILVIIAAVIVLRKNATVKVLDIVVPIMAVVYFLITIFVIVTNITSIPAVFARIFKEAFGLRQVGSRWIWSCSYEWCETRIILKRSRIRIRPMCRRSRRLRMPCTDGTGTGIRSIYRYDRHLQLYRNADAISTTEYDRRSYRNESTSDSYELPPWKFWSHLYRRDPLDVQFLNLLRNLVLCKIQCCILIW